MDILQQPLPVAVILALTAALWTMVQMVQRRRKVNGEQDKLRELLTSELREIRRLVEDLHRWHAPIVEESQEVFPWKVERAHLQKVLELLERIVTKLAA